jgi:molybdate transport system substrate-binding protein
MFSGSLAARFAVLLLALCCTGATAAEVKVWAGGVLRPVLTELKARYEGATRNTLVIEYGSSPEFARHLNAGQTFDVAILVPATIDGWIKQGRIATDSRSRIARAGLGVAVRKGAAKPALDSVEDLKRAMLGAKSVAHSREGPTRAQLMRLLDRLGIAADMKSKLKPYPGGGILKAVAQGEAEMAVSPIPTVLSTPGIDNAGALPPALQNYLELVAGVAANAKEPEGARAFIRLLSEPAAIEVIKARGFELFAQ